MRNHKIFSEVSVVVVSKVKCPQQYLFTGITSKHHKLIDSGLSALVFENSTEIILESMPTQEAFPPLTKMFALYSLGQWVVKGKKCVLCTRKIIH